MAKLTASASGTNRNFATPVRKNIGTNTMQMHKRRDESRNRDLLRAIENGLPHLLAHGQVALDVFDFHRRIVHQDADRERQTAERHDVDRLADAHRAG